MSALPRVLLLQIRDDSRAELQERDCFVESSGLPADCFDFRNVVQEPEFSAQETLDYDVLLIGGAGRHSVTERYPFTDRLREIVVRWAESGRPCFGSCFGHQFVAWALGGRVITDLDRREVGTHEVELTPSGRADPLFAGVPLRFDAQFGHNDRVVELPPGAVELARTALCPHQAFRLENLPVWGCQFHVELDLGRLQERARWYRDGYLDDPEELAAFERSLRPSPWASQLLARFFTLAIPS